MHWQLMEEYVVLREANYFTRFLELFTIPRNRRASLAAFVVMIAQQAFYSSNVFVDAGYTKSALLASLSSQLTMTGWLTIDTFGRRNSLTAGLCFLIPASSSVRIPPVALFVFIFAGTFNGLGSAFAAATNLFFASVLSVTFPRILSTFTAVGAFGFYAGLNIVALVMIFFLLPETKQRTLEELDYVFTVPTRRHIAYQGGTFLSYWIKRWVFFQRDAHLEPLYDFEEVESVTVFEKEALIEVQRVRLYNFIMCLSVFVICTQF
ncbi:sugar transporter [Mycena metata]|uniref:Sugar transporter n=1 Tax=Mycena metata TaxID=1033252 RepID=A0AAD7I611_9AGAR|nr:sugar transporter [Mycena metata]